MHPAPAAARLFASARAWTILAILAPVGMLVMSGLMLLDLRKDAWDKAILTSQNLLQVIERDVARNIEIIDLSLLGALENLSARGVSGMPPDLRQLVLFDRAASATDMGVMLVLDENGDTIADSHAVPPRKLNNRGRDYFQAHRERSDLGLLVSRPVISHLLGVPVIVLSRRINKPDGSFGGLVSASLRLSYFQRLFQDIGLGTQGAINLYLRDGTRLMRHPYAESEIGGSVAGTDSFARALREGRGTFVGASRRDTTPRLFVFTTIANPALVLNVVLSADEIEAEWRVKALGIGLVVLILCGLTIGLSLLFGRELRRRAVMQAELARLSLTDALTGLPNRRRFEEAVALSLRGPADPEAPHALLVVDADHFKSINDRYGHTVGDAVLKDLARCLAASVRGPTDLVCRVGGEEFVMLLPGADEEEAQRVAGRLHAAVADLEIGSVGVPKGAITVSVGLASTRASDRPSVPPADLYRLADAALYEAKAKGRNQTRAAGQRRTIPPHARLPLRRAGAA